MNTDEIMQIALDLVDFKEITADSRIYLPGDIGDKPKILYGIDITQTELLYAKQQNYDCVIAHHPVGLINSWKVFWKHLDQLLSKGIPEKEAKEIIEKKITLFKFSSHARNYDAIPAFARILGIPFMNVHCPSDELGRRLIANAIEKLGENSKLGDLQSHLENEFIEFKLAATKIEIAKGNKEDKLGNWIFSHGALTNGGFDIADLYYKNGQDTVIYIHIAPGELVRILNLEKGNLVITGHLVSDSIGINPFLDELEKKGCSIVHCGGLIRQ